MRIQNLTAFVTVVVCIGCVSAKAYATGVSGYTSIDYYADTNAVDAYSETDLDGDLVGNYDAMVSLTVVDQNSNLIASGSMRDTSYQGFAYVELLFSGVADSTYRAVGAHKAVADMWDWDPSCYYRSCIFYYDDWFFTSFQSQDINAPWYYYFLSPGFQETHIYNPAITVGTTYDSDTVETPASPDIFLTNAKVYEVTASFDGFRNANVNVANSQHWHDICGNPNDTQPFTIRINFSLPPGGQLVADRCQAIPQNIPQQDYNIAGAVTCAMDDSQVGHMTIPARRRYGGFADKNPGIHFTIGANKSGQVGTIDTPGVVRVLCNQ